MSSNSEPIRILAVEDDDVDHLVLERALRGCDTATILERVTTITQARDRLRESKFHCMLLDYHLPDGSGLELLDKNQEPGACDDLAVIMLTGEDDIAIAVEALKCGAQDYLPKNSICSQTLDISISKALETFNLQRQVKESQKRIEELAFFDTLTGLPNRHVFVDRLEQLILIAKREQQTFLVGLLDMNGFKAINDNLGHQAGDIVLQTVACRLASVIRDSDTVARFGGDEFVLLLPKADPMYGAEIFSKRILQSIEEPITVLGTEVRVGISIGLSEFPNHGEDGDTLLKRADEAMYTAKTNKSGWKLAD